MITTKEAFLHAAQHVKDLFENAYDIRLEEIEHIDPFKSDVEVTVSFLMPASTSSGASSFTNFLASASAQNRIFKIIVVNKNDGDFVRMKMMK